MIIQLSDLIWRDGKPYLRVSKITAGDYSKVPFLILEMKKEIGTDVHHCIEMDIKGEFEIPALPRSGPYFSSYLIWKEESGVKFHSCEQRYWCDKLMITGQIDALAQFPDQKGLYIIDFKTSAKEAPASWSEQAHLYYHLLKVSGIKASKTFYFIKLDRDGKAPKIFTYAYDAKTMKRCLAKAKWDFSMVEKKEEKACDKISEDDIV